MKNKKIILNDDARNLLKKGVDILALSVKATLGPGGRNVVIENDYGMPTSTKDGVTVAKSIKLKDSFENVGAQMVKEAAIQTNESVGDGTTTATVLAQAIINEGLKSLSVGVNAIEVKRGIEKGTKYVVEQLRALSTPISSNKEVAQIGTISANGDSDIGKYISEAMDEVGREGVILIEEGKSQDILLNIVEGMQFDRGYLSPYFINNNATMQCEFENPYILLYAEKISSIKPIVKVLEQIVTENRPLLIIAEDIENEALATLVVNKARGSMSVCAVKAPDFGDRRREILEDIAVLTGGTVITSQKGMKLEQVTKDQFGQSRRVTIDNKKTTIVDGKGTEEAIVKRAEEIKLLVDNSKSDYEKEKYQSRLAKLSGGVAVIEIGAESELEMKDKKLRTEDALHATKAAVEDGILPGGGIAYMIVNIQSEDSQSLPHLSRDEQIGFDILIRSLKSPFNTIVENCGLNGEAIWAKIERVKEDNTKVANRIGFDARKGEVTDMFESGIIDPTKVCITALQKAASVAGMILTTESVICNEEEKNQKEIDPNDNF